MSAAGAKHSVFSFAIKVCGRLALVGFGRLALKGYYHLVLALALPGFGRLVLALALALSAMQAASSFDMASVAASSSAAPCAVQHGDGARLPQTSSPRMNETLGEAAVWCARVKDRMNV